MEELRQEALAYYSPLWNVNFYDSIAQYVPNYVPSSGRTTFKAHVDLPNGAGRPIAVLAQNGIYFQDNVQDPKSYQYWGDIDTSTGNVEIPRVKAGIYRLTIYADGIFGDYVKDDVEIIAGEVHTVHARWREENAGTEIWRIGVPDKSSGEYKHGYELDPVRPNHPEQYRIYWGIYDFPKEFPDGVQYKVGESTEVKDLNYVHWSVFGGYANSVRPIPYYENVNNWTILFNLSESQFHRKRLATFTVQLAGAKTAAGNTDVFNSTQPWANLPYTVAVNGHGLTPWVIPWVDL
jgi:rhamnogalacturonan endolyase